MKHFNIFIDGNQGTTGLELEKVIKEQKKNKNYKLNIIKLPEKNRKSLPARLKMIEQSDITVLCLPDEVAKKTIEAIEKSKIDKKSLKIIDTSTAFRVEKNWTYGFKEITKQSEKISKSHYVSNPGCYALAFIASIRPLSEAKLWKGSPILTAIGASGYSGGGKKLIGLAKKKDFPPYALYSLNLNHKHLKEMQTYALLKKTPIFQPTVVSDYRGMIVSTAISNDQIGAKTKNLSQTIFDVLKNYYAKSERIKIKKAFSEQEKSTPREDEKLIDKKFLSFSSNNHTNTLDIIVAGNENYCMLHARLDNLGIGAARNALENLLLMVKNL